MKESFKQKMQENKPPLTFKNTKKNICLEKKREFFWTLTPNGHGGAGYFQIKLPLQRYSGWIMFFFQMGDQINTAGKPWCVFTCGCSDFTLKVVQLSDRGLGFSLFLFLFLDMVGQSTVKESGRGGPLPNIPWPPGYFCPNRPESDISGALGRDRSITLSIVMIWGLTMNLYPSCKTCWTELAQPQGDGKSSG